MLRKEYVRSYAKQQSARQTRRNVSPRPQLLLGHMLKAKLPSPNNQLFCQTRQPPCIDQPHGLHPQPHPHIITSRFGSYNCVLSYQWSPSRSSNSAGNCAASASSDSASHAWRDSDREVSVKASLPFARSLSATHGRVSDSKAATPHKLLRKP